MALISSPSFSLSSISIPSRNRSPLSYLLLKSTLTRRKILPPSPGTSFRIRASAATVDSGNGAVVADKPKDSDDDSDYGRKFFPLAAVVGQDAIKTALLLGTKGVNVIQELPFVSGWRVYPCQIE